MTSTINTTTPPSNDLLQRAARRATLEHGRCEQRPSTVVSVEPVSARTVLQQYRTGLSRQADRTMKGTRLTDRQNEVAAEDPRVRRALRSTAIPYGASAEHRLTFPTAVKTHLEALERKGWIELKPGMDRGIVLLREGMPVFDPRHAADGPRGHAGPCRRDGGELPRTRNALAPDPPAGRLLLDRPRRQHGPRGLPVRGHRRREAEPRPARRRGSDRPHRAGDHPEVLPPGGPRPDRAPAPEQQTPSTRRS